MLIDHYVKCYRPSAENKCKTLLFCKGSCSLVSWRFHLRVTLGDSNSDILPACHTYFIYYLLCIQQF